MKNKTKNLVIIVLLVGVVSIAFSINKIFDKKDTNIDIINKENKNINALAVFIKQSDGSYKTATSIPQSGYTLNTDKSTCNKGAIPAWSNNTLNLANLTEENTNCYLFFDEDVSYVDTILGKLKVKNYSPDFSQVATTDEGVYRVSDGMYGGYSYYWRGAATTNYVKFAGFCWRIIRINGDGSIRLIYDGTTCHANGVSTPDSIAVASQAYNSSSDRSEYVGWTYEGELQRPTNNVTATPSNAKTQTETWFNTNITGTNATKVADGKFCNDRNTASGYSWSSQPSSDFYYARYTRRNSNSPTLSCPTGDVYTLKAGLITMDEAMYAGGRGANNKSYYLYSGQYYWTMSPSYWDSSGSYARVFYVDPLGNFDDWYVNLTLPGVRPVINLVSDVTFVSGGNGTLDNPYVVEGSE